MLALALAVTAIRDLTNDMRLILSRALAWAAGRVAPDRPTVVTIGEVEERFEMQAEALSEALSEVNTLRRALVASQESREKAIELAVYWEQEAHRGEPSC